MTNNLKTKEFKQISLRSYMLGIAVLWSLLIALSLGWNLKSERSITLEGVRIEARTAFEKDVVYRRWNAKHGEIYAPVTEATPSNPYLDVPERDITTLLGKKLTQINPAYMTRQAHELAKKTSGIKGHITSLNPIRPTNAPDNWEAKALKAFQTGVKEVSSVEEMEGENYMRLMRPLLIEKACLKCHAKQGYKLGDIRGGISLSIPLAPRMAIGRSHILTLIAGHGLLWIAGLFGIGFGMRRLNQQIHERMEAEKSLRENEKKYKSLTNNLNVGVYRNTPGPKGKFIEVNPAIVKMFGYDSKEEYLEVNVSDLYQNPDDRKEYNEKILRDGFVKNEELQLQKKDGTSLIGSVSAVALKDERGEVKYYDGIIEDITERKRVEEALRESEERYQLATKGGNVGVWDWNLTTGDMFVSPDLKAMLGYDDSEIKNHIEEWGKHVYAEDTEAVMKEANACIEGAKKDYHVEHRMVHKDGSIRWFLASGKVVRDESGKPIRFSGTDTDITKLKNLEGQLRQAQKMEAIAVLAGGIAHQFNNALSPITASIDMLELDFPDEQNIATYTKQMKGSANRMALLTDQLLAYARGGKYQARILSLSDFMRDTLPLIKHTIDPAIQIDTDIPRDIFNIKADITQMQMVLSAILSNASEAIKGEGRIRITCKNEMITDERAKDFPGLKPGLYVNLKIEDDGRGMDEETKSRIFEPFFTTKFQGRGLGMAAAYGIIKNHDGWILVDSELGKGTTVRIFLPATEAKVKELKKPKIEPAKGTETILVIEDEEMVMDVSRALLEKLDYRVLGAKTGNEAINVVKTFDGDIDLAILDIVMPDMDGKSIYPRIMEARPNLKVLVCSGYSIDGPAQEILNAGAQDFIQKPFSMAKLSEKLKKALEGK